MSDVSIKGKDHQNTPYRRITRRGKRMAGFTLLDILITVAILGILAIIAVPTLGYYKDRNTRDIVANDLANDLRFARNQATQSANAAVVCPSANGKTCGTDWDQGWIVYRPGYDVSDPLSAQVHAILRQHDALSRGRHVASEGAAGHSGVAFDSGGFRIGPTRRLRVTQDNLERSVPLTIEPNGIVRVGAPEG